MSESAARVRLCAVNDIEPGEMLQLTLAGFPPLAVYRVGDQEFFCTQDMCTHGNASLADEGDLEGYIVECGWHGGKFDVRTGAPCAPPCIEPLKTFAVRVEDGAVFLEHA